MQKQLWIWLFVLGGFSSFPHHTAVFANSDAPTLLLELGQPPEPGQDVSGTTLPQEDTTLWLEVGDNSLVDADEIQPGVSVPGTYAIPADSATLWLELGDKARHEAGDGPGATIPTDPSVLRLALGDEDRHDAGDEPGSTIPTDPSILWLALGDASTADDSAPLYDDPSILLLELGNTSANAGTIPFPDDPATLFLELGTMEAGAWVMFRKGGDCRGEFWVNSAAYHCDAACHELPVLFEQQQIVTLYYQVPDTCEFSGYTDRTGRMVSSSELSTQAYAGDVITILFHQKP
jgi:hypothetical protein